ncbi:hypothetical protein BDW22DRAFT_1360615 [Trametopsis cervina]|nr:hypothetical protein BDW22DRAFT_1360615 [Trametopsis cervina]
MKSYVQVASPTLTSCRSPLVSHSPSLSTPRDVPWPPGDAAMSAEDRAWSSAPH